MATDTRKESLYRAGRLELAIQAYQRGQFETPSAAAKAFDVPRNTLLRRLAGVPPKRGSDAINRVLTQNEEDSLLKWIHSMDRRGMPPRQDVIRQMAMLLLAERSADVTLGKNWVYKFISRHQSIKSVYNRKYDYQRAKCEDPALLKAWFKRLQATVAEYGIDENDIYNFDETGFQMGVIATAKVVTSSDRAGRPRTTQPGNREWVTIIETISIHGPASPPLVIFEAVMHQKSWYENGLIPPNWLIAVSENGWTNNEIGLYWLEHVFNKHTRTRTRGRYRLLILDGHGSHVTPEFDQYCLNNSIIVLCMPAHSSHLLQPLDVACFSALKRSYGKLVERQMGLGVNHVDKVDFLQLYQHARAETITSSNACSGFAATGIVPFNPDRVLSGLLAKFRTPTPPLPPAANIVPTAETPHNITQLQAQTKLLKHYLRRRTQSPPSPSDRALAQLVKGCEIAMHSAVLLASENERLAAENARQKRKRAQKRSYVARGGIFTVAEARQLINTQQEELAEAAWVDATESRQPKQRAPPRCSWCNSLEHKIPRCPEYQAHQLAVNESD